MNETIETIDKNIPKRSKSRQGILSTEWIVHFLSKEYTFAKIARQLNVSYQAVYQFYKRHEEEIIELLNYEDINILRLKKINNKIAKSIDDETINKAGLKDRHISMKFNTETHRLLENKSTGNYAHSIKISDEEIPFLEKLGNAIAKQAMKAITPHLVSGNKKIDNNSEEHALIEHNQ